MVERKCPVCETLYPADPKRLAYGRQTTCSRKCSYELRGAGLTVQKISHTCPVCDKVFERRQSTSPKEEPRHGLVFCSPKCQYAARGLGLTPRKVTKPYTVTEGGRAAQQEGIQRGCARRKAEGRYACSEATKAKISISVSKLIASGGFPRVSKLEDQVAYILDGMGVSYLRQHHFRETNGRYGAVADFFLPEQNLVIEVNGTFWHADSRVFPDGPTHASQHRTLSRYARKVALLAERGIRVAEVWEQDLNDSPGDAVQLALGSKPIALPPPADIGLTP